jgi:hypothetical protein
MNSRSRWLDGFVKWFFNASPLWVDERQPVHAERPPRDRRAANGERLRNPEARQAGLRAHQRRGGS